MDPKVHDQLESIRRDISSNASKRTMDKMSKHPDELYEFLGLGFAVENIHKGKPLSGKEVDSRLVERVVQCSTCLQKKSSKHTSPVRVKKRRVTPEQNKRRDQRSKTHHQVRQQYFDNIPNF